MSTNYEKTHRGELGNPKASGSGLTPRYKQAFVDGVNFSIGYH